MVNKNKIKLEFLSLSKNEAFARNVIACYVLGLNPNVSELADLKTAVSEAVTNAIVHGYAGQENKAICPIYIQCKLTEHSKLLIKIKDKGKGIEDIKTAMQPLYTTDEGGERSGMGFTIMENFMDEVIVKLKYCGWVTIGYGMGRNRKNP